MRRRKEGVFTGKSQNISNASAVSKFVMNEKDVSLGMKEVERRKG